MYYLDEKGQRVYTLKVRGDYARLCMCAVRIRAGLCNELTRFARCHILCVQKADPAGNPTHSAHPARFSPDDKFSRERVTLKRRIGELPTQKPAEPV